MGFTENLQKKLRKFNVRMVHKKGTHSKYETCLAFGLLPLSESLSRNMHMAPQPILNWHWGDAAGKLLVQKKPKKELL